MDHDNGDKPVALNIAVWKDDPVGDRNGAAPDVADSGRFCGNARAGNEQEVSIVSRYGTLFITLTTEMVPGSNTLVQPVFVSYRYVVVGLGATGICRCRA